MKPYQKLREVHDILTAYHREQPSSSISRIITEVEKEIRHACSQDDSPPWPHDHTHIWRRIEAIEKSAKGYADQATASASRADSCARNAEMALADIQNWIGGCGGNKDREEKKTYPSCIPNLCLRLNQDEAVELCIFLRVLSPGQQEWAENYLRRDPVAFWRFVRDCPKIKEGEKA